jgi:hypothetical protein
VRDVYFKQLVVLHKVTENFDIAPCVGGFVRSHDHKAWREAQRKKAEAGGWRAVDSRP